MFGGSELVEIRSTLPEEEFYAKAEEALRPLGRVRIDKRGGIDIEPKESLKSFLSELSITGSIRRRGTDAYEVDLSYNLSPSVVNWILAVVLFLVTCVGAIIIIVPLMEKGKVAQAIDRSLRDLEDTAGSPAIEK